MVTEQSSAASGPGPAYRYTVGYALPPSKVESVIQPSLVALAAERGMRLVAVDASRPLAEQGPLDLLIHKRYDKPWRAQLEAFSALHPSVPVVDPPAAILRLVDRLAMLDVVSELHPVAVNSAAGAPAAEYCLSVPNQVAVHDAAALASYGADQDDHPLGALRFPLIAKPLAVDGSAGSHAMSLVYRREGLRGVQAPVVLQEFVNHGGVLFKVYVVGGRATCVRRRSLPDVPADRLLDLGQDASVPFANISNLPPAADSTAAPGGGADGKGDSICGDNDVEMPPACFVDEVSRGLRRALGLNLFNFDLIRATELDGDGRRRYFIIDINYFPGYAKMPGYETALTDFFSEMLRARPPVDDAHLGRASSIDSIAAHVPGIDLVAEAEPAAQTRA